MPTASFSADTEPFVKEVKKAEGALDSLGKASDKTAHELDQFGVQLVKNGNDTKTYATQVQGFDSVLQKAGINIGPTAKALDEVAAASGKTAGELGTLATAGLVVGTAMAAWEFGRAIAGFFKLDEAISKATASWLGWGDVAKETAGAQADTIAAANKLGAATNDYATAIKFLTEKHKERLTAVKEVNAADIASGEAWAELNSTGTNYAETLATMNAADVEAIKLKLEQGAKVETLAKAYYYTASQIQAVSEWLKVEEKASKDAAEVAKQAAADQIEAAKSLRDFHESAAKRQFEISQQLKSDALARAAVINDAVLAEMDAQTKLNARYGLTATGGIKQVEDATSRYRDAMEALHKAQADGLPIAKQEAEATAQYADDLLKEAQAADEATQAFWKGRDALKANADGHTEAAKAAGVYMNQLHMLVSDPKLASFFGGNAAAVGLYGGGHGGFTPEEAAAMGAGQFINFAGSSMATGRTFGMNPTINIWQPLGTPQAIASAVGNALTQQAQATGTRY